MSRQKLSRRDFLKVGGAAGAALAGATPLGNLARVAGQADTTVNVLTVGDPWDLALQSVVDQFTEATGITVNSTASTWCMCSPAAGPAPPRAL